MFKNIYLSFTELRSLEQGRLLNNFPEALRFGELEARGIRLN
jgi:hypothetical protein